MSWRLELPLVPSLNNAYANRNGGRYPTRKTLAWKAEAGWLVKLLQPTKIIGRYKLTVLVPEKMRGDVDNRLKLVSDLLSKDLGVLPDDRNAVETTCRRDPSVDPKTCMVIVESVE